MGENTATSFWKARFAQGFLVLVAMVLVAPVLWNFITIVINNLFYGAELPLFAALSTGVYPRSLLAGFIFAVCLAFRSVSWGKITWLFSLLCGVFTALLVDFLLRFIAWVFTFSLPTGFGHEPFLSWLFAWAVAALLSYGLLRLAGLSERYKENERHLLPAALWIVVVFALYVPTFYTFLLLAFILKDDLPLLLARGPVNGALEPISLILAGVIAFTLVARLRRVKVLSKAFLLITPMIIIGFLLALHLATVTRDEWMVWIIFYSVLALMTGIISAFFIPFLLGGISTKLSANPREIKQTSFPFLVVIVLAIAGAPLWQSFTILWRALVFGMPPASFFLGQINWAMFFSAVFFALPAAIYAGFRNEINFAVMFVIAIFAGCFSAFFPAGYMGLDFGMFFNHFGWPMLTFGPLCLMSWVILSLMKQIRRM